jgi:glycosyltransferase involved in cell wall biosynthesis
MKIAIIAHGRFHAFDLVPELLKRGHDVTLFTNYPRWAVARFGVPLHCVRTFPVHGVVSRAVGRLRDKTGWSFDAWIHPWFSRWAARQLRRESWDVVHAWTGVAEEIYSEPSLRTSCKMVMRGSAHIQTQAEILAAEEVRVRRRIDQPSKWMILREQREYDLADKIMVLSSFAFDSFRERGVPESRLRLLPLGSEVGAFRPAADVIQARKARIASGAPIRVLYVGGVCYRKGLLDLREIVGKESTRFDFRFIGPVWPEAESIVSALRGQAEFVGKIPHKKLAPEYAWGDVFIFPTIEDGYAAVLAQASAAALPILTTANCAGPDLVREGRTGWVLPIRNPQAFIERLNWCDSHRGELAEMVTAAWSEFRTRNWFDVAVDFEELCTSTIGERVGLTRHSLPPKLER